MKTVAAIAVVVLACGALAAGAEKQEERSAVKTLNIGPGSLQQPKASAEAARTGGSPTLAGRAVAARGADFDAIPAVLGLSGDKLEQYKNKLAERNEGYDKWVASARGQEYTAAQRELNMAKRLRNGGTRLADAEKKYQPLRAEQEKVRRELRRKLNEMFEPAQLRLWAGHMLYSSVIRPFARDFSEEQKEQAFIVCATLTASLTAQDLQRDPYLEPTDAQKEKAAELIKLIVAGK